MRSIFRWKHPKRWQEWNGSRRLARRRAKKGKSVNNNLKKILEQVDVQRGMADGPEPDYSKLDDVEYGDVVAIEWQGEFEGMVDYGYVMGFPGIEEGDANLGAVIHVPRPQNPGGKENAHSEWITLYDIGTNFGIKRLRRVCSMNERTAA